MYNEYSNQPSHHAQGAAEIVLRVREQEKKMALMNAQYHSDAGEGQKHNRKKSKNPFRALLSIFLA